MRRISVLIIAVCFSLSIRAQLDAHVEKQIDSLMKSNYAATEPGAVLLIAQNGVPVFHQAYGLANMELKVFNQLEYVFAIGSMSKQFTTVCLLHLQDAGKLSLDDDIKKYLPEYNTHGELITIRHLLTHTSGIPSFTEMDTFLSLFNIDLNTSDISKIFMDKPLLFKPGTNWSYSNSGYTLAGMIVEKVSGITLETYLWKHLFLPAEMYRSGIGSNDKVIARMVTGYDIGNLGYMPTKEYSWSWTFAAGGIVSTTSDLLLWDESFYDDKILSKKARAEAFSPYLLANGTSTNYGLGWDVGYYKDIQFIRHGGAIGGFLSEAVRIPSEHMYIVILSNNTSKGPAASVDKILNIVFDLGIESVDIYESENDLSEYTGVYQIERTGGRLVSNYSKDMKYRYISTDGSVLFSQITGGSKVELNRIGKDEFTNGDPYTRFIFNRNDKNEIIGISVVNLPTGLGPIDYSPKTALPLPEEKKNIVVLSEILEKHAGIYDFGSGFQIAVTVADNRIFIQATGQSKFEIFAESETQFYLTVVDASIEFLVDENGNTTGMILHQGGDYPGEKIE